MLMKGSIEKDGKILNAEVKRCETDKECSAMLAEGWDLITVVGAGKSFYNIHYIVGRYIPEAAAKNNSQEHSNRKVRGVGDLAMDD